MQQSSNSNKDPVNILTSQNISQHICKVLEIQNTHTHIHKTSLTNFIFQKQVKTI